MVLKYRDVIRMTLFGRHDKLLNDTTSIYQGYDRYATTTTGGGINNVSITNNGTIGFTAAPSVFISNASNINCGTIASTLAAATSTINSIAVNTGGTGWTTAPNVLINGTGSGATATATNEYARCFIVPNNARSFSSWITHSIRRWNVDATVQRTPSTT